jgi:hypothetical protein
MIGTQVRTTTDLGAWLRWAPGRFALALGLGRRYGVREVAANVLNGVGSSAVETRETTRTSWWLAEANYWFAPRLGVHAVVGRSPPDLQFGTAGGKFLRLGFQTLLVAPRARSSAPSVRATGLVARRKAAGFVALELAGMETASEVELMADFTDWRPVAMEPAGEGRWQLRIPMSSGVHFVNIRSDGGSWRPPPGTRVVTDEFGQRTGVVVIEE